MVLERAGLVQRQIIGREHYCALHPQPLRQANAWLEHYRQFWELRLNQLEEFLVRKQHSSAQEKKSHANTGSAQWMGPGDVLHTEAELDVRFGSSYRILMRGWKDDYDHTGTYQIVEPP